MNYASTLGHGHPLLHILPALVPALVLILGLDAFCLINLARSKSVRNAPKLAWVIVILAVSAPVGALLYLFFGMDRSARQRGVAPAGAVRPAAPPALLPLVTGGPPAGSRLIVTTAGLTKDYNGNGLFGVDLAVPLGCVYGLVGLNGAGKTTLLSILSATRRASAGTVTMAVDRRRVAVCPDVPAFEPWLTASEVVDLARTLVAPELGDSAVAAALQTAGLADSADRRVGGFSRGMIQRLGLACALVSDPELLILDEPTSALDPVGRADMLDLVARMRGRRTVIFSSHILADVQRVADHVGILRDGRLLYQGTARELIDTYLTPRWLIRIAGGARQVSCEPAAADLESAFLALTGAE
jgi:ABC-2 type transport system ATP-binding protein